MKNLSNIGNRLRIKGKTAFYLFLGLLFFTAVWVFVIDPKTLLNELEWTTGLWSAMIFLFLIVGLYFGDSIEDEGDRVGVSKTAPADCGLDIFSGLNISGFDFGWDDFISGILGILLAIVVYVAIVLLALAIWSILSAVITSILAFGYYLFYRSARHIERLSERTAGDVRASLLYAMWYTLVSSGWMFGLLYVGVHHPHAIQNFLWL